MNTKTPKFVSFSTQKGGVGKTTFTTLVASVLHYRMGYNVVVMDCDYPQYSLSRMREQDLKTVMQNEHFKRLAQRQFSQINKKTYPIITCKPEDKISIYTYLDNVLQAHFEQYQEEIIQSFHQKYKPIF